MSGALRGDWWVRSSVGLLVLGDCERHGQCDRYAQVYARVVHCWLVGTLHSVGDVGEITWFERRSDRLNSRRSVEQLYCCVLAYIAEQNSSVRYGNRIDVDVVGILDWSSVIEVVAGYIGRPLSLKFSEGRIRSARRSFARTHLTIIWCLSPHLFLLWDCVWMMDITMQQKDCDALAGLFQHIVTDLRVCAWPCNNLSRLVYFLFGIFHH